MEQSQMRPGMSPRWQQPQGPNMAPNMMQAQQMRAGMQAQQQQPNQASTLIAQLQQPPAGVMQQPGINPQFQQGPRMDGSLNFLFLIYSNYLFVSCHPHITNCYNSGGITY